MSGKSHNRDTVSHHDKVDMIKINFSFHNTETQDVLPGSEEKDA